MDRIRTRVKDQRSSVGPKLYSDYWGANTSSYVTTAGGTYKEMFDTVTSRFAERRARGDVIMSPMTSVTASMTGESTQYGQTRALPSTPGTNWRKYDGNQSRFCTGWGNTAVGAYWITLPGDALLDPADISNADIEACTRARSQIGRSNTDMWENLAEAHKTMELLRSPFAAFFKKSKILRTLVPITAPLELWLQYRYAVRPLVSSIDGVLKNLAKNTRPVRHTARGTAVVAKTNHLDYFVTPNTYWGTCEFTVERRRSHSHECRAMSIDDVVSDFEYTYGLAAKSLLTLPWELIPFSFVVDWFVNVGDLLGAYTQSFFPRSLGQCYVTTDTYSEYRRCIGTRAFNPAAFEVESGFGGWTRVDVIRKKRVVGLTGPGLVLKQNFRLEEWTRIADMTALASMQIRNMGMALLRR